MVCKEVKMIIIAVLLLLPGIFSSCVRESSNIIHPSTSPSNCNRRSGDIEVTSPTHPDPNRYFNSTDPVFMWEPPYDVSRIKGYSYIVDEAPSSEPDRDSPTANNGTTSTTPGEFHGLTDGNWYFHINVVDVNDRWGNTSHFGFNIDTTKPFGNITIEFSVFDEHGEPSTNKREVELTIYAHDNHSGIKEMQLFDDEGQMGLWEDYVKKKNASLSGIHGLKTIGVRFRNNAGLVSDIFQDSIYYDVKGPENVIVESPTHPDPSSSYNNVSPVFTWDAPYDVSGVKCYSYLVDDQPETEPPKTYDDINGEITGTIPGEFPTFEDGTWYFHIVACDGFDQWGNTTHFRFNIDTDLVKIDIITPNQIQWFNTTEMRVVAKFTDSGLFGLNTDSIQYSVKLHGKDFSDWSNESIQFEDISFNDDGFIRKIQASLEIEVPEGATNAVKWRIFDVAEDEMVISESIPVRVDLTPPTFKDPFPGEDELLKGEVPDGSGSGYVRLPCGITVIDNAGGSGVDGRSIEYSVNRYGYDYKYFINWTYIDNNSTVESIYVKIWKYFPPKDNYIMWRAMDIAGNGYSLSNPRRIRQNAPPHINISHPSSHSRFRSGETILLSANGTTDDYEDRLRYFWEINEEVIHKMLFRKEGKTVTILLNKPGLYYISLSVDDGYGYNLTQYIESIQIYHDIDIDGVEDQLDAFPTDPAASVDNDSDGYPDEWNEGKTESNSTTGLKLDVFPNDPDRWEERTDRRSDTLLILGTLGGVFLAIYAVVLFITKRKK